MGGYGSGRWYRGSKKDTVEECSVLAIGGFQRAGFLRTMHRVSGRTTWTDSRTGEERSSIGFDIDPGDGHCIRFHYNLTRRNESVDYRVQLTQTRLPWGGPKWWFICPLICNGVSCGRRVAKLYLAPGARYFGCRHCHDLTYTSCQESHQWDGMFLRLARDTGLSPAEVRRSLEEDFCEPKRGRRRRRK